MLWVTGSKHELWATMSYKWKQIYHNSFNHSRKDEQVGSSSSTDVSAVDVENATDSNSFYRPSSTETKIEQIGGENIIYSFIIRKARIAKRRRTNVARAPCRRNPADRADRITNCRNMWRHENSRPQSSETRSCVENATQICSGCASPGNFLESLLSMQNQISSGDDEKPSNFHLGIILDPFIRTILWNLLEPAKS